jgi:hypothetical protein
MISACRGMPCNPTGRVIYLTYPPTKQQPLYPHHCIPYRNFSSHRIRQHQIRQICHLFGTICVRCQCLRHQSVQEFQHRLISRVVLGPVQIRAFSNIWIEVRDETDEVRSHIQTAVDIEDVGRVELALELEQINEQTRKQLSLTYRAEERNKF